MLRGEDKVAKVSQISQKLKARMPSVTSALKKLPVRGLVVHERYGCVRFTPEGDKAAEDVVHRHKALSRFFTEALDIEQETAKVDACKTKHVISPLSQEGMTKFIEVIEMCLEGEANFSKRYKYYLEHGEFPKRCLARGLKK